MKSNILSSLIDLLFPRTCFSCNDRIQNDIICESCLNSLEFLTEVCPVCGAYDQGKTCLICQGNEFQFDKARSVFQFNKMILNLIHDLKYDEMRKVAILFGKLTEDYLREFNPFQSVDIIAPVPLHKVKKRSRGFNQSQLLTAEISRRMNWPHEPNLIQRRRFTETQTKLGRKDRKKNVQDAFSLKAKLNINNKNILIVDDVFTTGATVNSISSVLRQNGAAKVFVLTIARA
ncbi:MAG: ComF family protein [Candidatus Cloacimonadales bacterium]|nr:ComF family protein [Candidatus Cloacimonadales bacterium]